MKIHNTLTKKIENIVPISPNEISIYSCGPTVYDRVHIGNLASFIYADTLRRILISSGYQVTQVMNYTDVDDKTIKRSHEKYPNEDPNTALEKLTSEEISHFNTDITKIGIDSKNINFIKATESIKEMQSLIQNLIDHKFAYISEDGIYFSIESYKKSGKKYGQLSSISEQSTSNARINNDEYDKSSIHDFALWKFAKDSEPSWDFFLNNTNYSGRPGWHIECSAMSQEKLGLPFDIHTGGVDLIFPHHENEIAQSTATTEQNKLANIFVHNEHLLVDNKKMSKSLNNFYTLSDIINKNINPMALRVLVLQAHYRSILHFSWDNLMAAENRLKAYQSMADLKWQTIDQENSISKNYINETLQNIKNNLLNDMNTPEALKTLSEFENKINDELIPKSCHEEYNNFLEELDNMLGLNLVSKDITDKLKSLIDQRNQARKEGNYEKADELRSVLLKEGLEIRDTKYGTIWNRI